MQLICTEDKDDSARCPIGRKTRTVRRGPCSRIHAIDTVHTMRMFVRRAIRHVLRLQFMLYIGEMIQSKLKAEYITLYLAYTYTWLCMYQMFLRVVRGKLEQHRARMRVRLSRRPYVRVPPA